MITYLEIRDYATDKILYCMELNKFQYIPHKNEHIRIEKEGRIYHILDVQWLIDTKEVVLRVI